jgi:hypothetical protein
VGRNGSPAGLRDLYSGLHVEHEPVGALYKPRQYFRRYADPEAILDVPEVAAHLQRIERSTRPYIETGWRRPRGRSVDPLDVHRHPSTVELARHLGYGVRNLNVGALEAHYRGEPARPRARSGRARDLA